MVLSNIQRMLLVFALLSTLIPAWLLVAPEKADAASFSCTNTRCTLYLSRAETVALGQGRVPAPPASLPWQLRGAYYALAYGHVWIAKQYGSWGWCSGFTLSYVPWETQGYFGYRC